MIDEWIIIHDHKIYIVLLWIIQSKLKIILD